MELSARRALAWSGVGAAAMVIGVRGIRKYSQRIAATADEQTRRLPGDELIVEPLGSITNAITIHALPQEVWPWLAQMGADRGGWYSYDRLDNGGHASVRQIVPELQQLTPGMIMPALPGATDGFRLASFDPEHFLVLGWNAPDGSWLVTWTFVLDDRGNGSTRLIVRVRGSAGYRFVGLPWPVAAFIVRLRHFIMERKQLAGIAERAEAHAGRSLG